MAKSFDEWYKQKNEGQQASNSAPVQHYSSKQVTTPSFDSWLDNKPQNPSSQLDSVNSWISSANKLLDKYNTLAGSWRADDDREYSYYDTTWKSLMSRAQGYREQFAGNAETLDAIGNVVRGLSRATSTSLQDYMRQFADEDEFNTAKRTSELSEKYKGLNYDQMNEVLSTIDEKDADYGIVKNLTRSSMTIADYDKAIADLEKRLGEYSSKTAADTAANAKNVGFGATLGYQPYYKTANETEGIAAQLADLRVARNEAIKRERYGNLSSNSDYRQLSKAAASTGDYTYDYINGIGGRDNVVANQDTAVFEGQISSPQNLKKYDIMTPEQIKDYNYLYATQGKDAANDYLDYISYDLEAKNAAATQQKFSEFATKHEVLSSMLSVPMNLASGIGLADVAVQNLARSFQNPDDWTAIHYNGPAMAPSIATSAIRGTVSQEITDATHTRIELDEEKHPILSKALNGKGLGDLYQLGMSMADSYATMALGQMTGIGALGTTLLGGSAGTQGVIDALDKGANDSQALTMGLLNGAFESLFEYVSLDKLLKDTTRGALKAIAQQAFVEGTEELNTTLFNSIADVLVMAENSDFERSVAEYMKSNPEITRERAQVMALEELAINMGIDFFGGALTGGIMGGGNYAVTTPRYYSKMYGDSVADLVAEAAELAPDDQFIKKIQQKIENGGHVGGDAIARVYDKNVENVRKSDLKNLSNQIGEQLKAYGETKNVKAVADALAKLRSGTPLNSKDYKAIDRSQYGRRVLNEINPMNAESGQYNTDWVKNLEMGTLDSDTYVAMLNAIDQQADLAPVERGINPFAVQRSFAEKTAPSLQLKTDTILKSVKAGVEVPEQKPIRSFSGSTASNSTQNEQVESSAPAAKSAPASVPKINNVLRNVTVDTAAKNYGKQAGAFKSIYQQGQDVVSYDIAFKQAYNYGMTGSVSYEAIKDAPSLAYLTEEQRQMAYKVGADAAKAEAQSIKAATEPKQAKITGGKRERKAGTVRGQDVSIEDMKKAFNDPQNKAYTVLSRFAEATGINIVLYKSKAVGGVLQGDQGRFSWDEDTIYVDINSGINFEKEFGNLSQYTMVRTFTHEFVHFLEKWSPDMYLDFRKLVFDAMNEKMAADNADAEHIPTVNELIKTKQEEYQRAIDPDFSYDAASREVLAEALTEILPQSSFIENLYNENQGLFQKLVEKLKEFISDLKSYFSGLTPNTKREAEVFQDADGAIRYMQSIVDAFDKIALQAVENYQAAQQAKEEYAKAPATATAKDITREGMKSVQGSDGKQLFQLRTMKQDVDYYMQDLKDAGLVGDGKVMSEKDLNDLYNGINRVMNYVEQHINELEKNEAFRNMDGTNRPFSPYKDNADPHYKMALDYSTLCRKRLLTQAITERLQASLKRAITPVEQVKIRNELKKLQAEGKKIDVACALCYVEAARLKSPKVINEFLNNKAASLQNYFSLKNARFKNEVYQKRQGDWKEAHGLARNATKADIKNAGLKLSDFNKFLVDVRKGYWEWAKNNDPAAYDRENAIIQTAEAMDNQEFLNANSLAKLRRETPDLYDAFIFKVRSATRSKAQEADVPYKRGDINQVGQAIIEQMNEESGFRHQSWSDFQAMHLLDTISAIIELSTRKAKVHTYTKVSDMVRFLGDTGVMMNMSLIPNGNTGFTADGGLDFDPVEGMPYEDMISLRDMFPDTAGNIAIGISDEQILAMLASPEIDYVIPYHTSGLNADMRRRMGIKAWKDYTKYQNESGDGEKPALREWFDINEALAAADGYAYMEQASEKYLQLCHERGLTPKFPQYLQKNADGSYSLRDDARGYWKLLVDRKMVNQKTRGVIAQRAVIPKFNEDTMLDILDNEVNSQAAIDAREAEDYIVNKLLNEEGVFTKQELEQARIIRDAAVRMAIQDTAAASEHQDQHEIRDTKPLFDVIDEIERKHAWSGKEIAAVYAEHPELDFVKRLSDKDPTAMTDLIDTMAGMDMKELNSFIWYPVEFRSGSERQAMRSGTTKFKKAVKDQMQIAINANKEKIGRNLGVKSGAVSYDDIRKLFYRLNSNEETIAIAEKVFAFIDAHPELANDFKFKTLNSDPRDRQTHGQYAGGKVRFDTSVFNSEYFTDEYKSGIILHELIHGCTSYAIWAVSKGKHTDNRNIRNAVYTLGTTFDEISNDKDFRGFYGITNENEMIAELANPKFREALKKKNLLQGIIDAIKRILGIDVKTAYDSVYGALETFLYNYNPQFASDYRKAADNTPAIRNMKREGVGDQFQIRDTTLSDREVLSRAADLAKDNNRFDEVEKSTLFIFKARLNKLEQAENRRQELLNEKKAVLRGREAKELPEAEKAVLRKVQNNLDTVNGQIRGYSDDVLKVEQTDVLKKVLRSARKVVAKEQYAHDRQVMQAAKARQEETAAQRKYKNRIAEEAMTLSEWLRKNSDKEHVPEILKKPVAELLASIDFSSKRALEGGELTKADRKFASNLVELKKLIEGQQSSLEGKEGSADRVGAYLDISQENREFLNELADAIAQSSGTFTLNRMTTEQLEAFSKFMKNLTRAIRQANAALANARFQNIPSMAQNSMQHFDSMGKATTADGKPITKFLTWQNATPFYAFKRFGEAGEALFDGFTRGWEKLAFNSQEVIDFAEKTYTAAEINKWQNQIHNFTLEDGSKIKMTTAQIMGLSQLMKREQAMKHITVGGIRIGDISAKEQNGKRKTGVPNDTEHYHFTTKDLQDVIGVLSDRELKVAESLRKYMGKRGGEWGNAVSMARFGYEFYTEGENYYPIRTDANGRPMRDTDEQSNSMFRLLNLSSSKSLNPKANNALIVDDIFDVFSTHMADMAKLNALGLPLLDAIKWYNYTERSYNDDGTMNEEGIKKAMESAFGTAAGQYFKTLLKDINGEKEGRDRTTGLSGKLISNYKIAAVGANLRVALLQPTSYVRAMAVLKPGNLANALLFKRGAIKEALKYSGTAVWKDLGYYDTDIAKGIKSKIEHADTVKDKIAEASMILAEKMDKVTWGKLWIACKLEAKGRNSKLTGEELNRATADIFREVIYGTQVMDSTLTRSQLMRGTTTWDKLTTAFMAEPTVSYNILMDAASQYAITKRQTNAQEAWKRTKGKIGTAITTYLAAAAVSALAESIADAFRDDDDYETFLQKIQQALLGEDKLWEGNLWQDLTIVGKIPVLKDMLNAAKGNKDSGNMGIAAISNVATSVQIWKETIDLATGKLAKPTKTTYYGNMTDWGKIYKSLQAASQLTGIAGANMTRDVLAIWNSTVGYFNPKMKVKTYDPGVKSSVKYAFTDGYMTEATALSELINAGFKEDEAKRMVAQWKYSEFDLDGNGTPTQEEVALALEKGNYTQAQKESIWSEFGYKKEYTEDIQEQAKAKIWLDSKAITYNSSNWEAGLKDSTLSSSDKDTLVNAYGSTWFAVPYEGIRAAGYSPEAAYDLLSRMDADGNNSVKQEEAFRVLQNMSDAEAAKLWSAFGWKTDYASYKAKH